MNIQIVIPVYNETEYLNQVLSILRAQQLPQRYIVNITIVNDGSDSKISQLLDQQFHSANTRIHHHNNNQGRSAALNTGCKHNNADILLLLDADCVPQGQNFLSYHLNALEKADISCGKLTANKSKNLFWDQYQQNVVKIREQEYANGNPSAFTTANIAIRKEFFLKVKGFNEKYRHYGFEDRDFLLRCQKAGGQIAYTPEAVVSHDSTLSMQIISKKMLAAGQYTAPIFRKDHPYPYRQMPYGKIDLNLHPGLNRLWPLLNRLRSILTPQLIDSVLAKQFFSYFIKSKLVKLISALHFMAGTHSNKQPRLHLQVLDQLKIDVLASPKNKNMGNNS